jgi:D-sedoheptulose 7-phosphate isomerase
MNYFTHFGKYLLMLKGMFTATENKMMFWREYIKQCVDIGIGSLTRANPVRAISLCDNSAVVTAIANDIDYPSIFEQQLQLLGAKGDLLLVISASGNSINLIKAVEIANAMGIISYSLTGFDGGKLKEITKGKNIHIETPKGTYGLVEDTHLAICHVITECIRSIK